MGQGTPMYSTSSGSSSTARQVLLLNSTSITTVRLLITTVVAVGWSGFVVAGGSVRTEGNVINNSML